VNHSINLEELTDAQRQSFDELGVEPGDRVYVQKLAAVSDASLLAASLSPGDGARDFPSIVRALASRFQRHPKTIASRLRRLRVEAHPENTRQSAEEEGALPPG
jgi:hypothetical protein